MLLEGHTVHLPAPKTPYRQDILFQGDTPIFCTSKDELSYVRGGVVDDRETQMMKVRWRVFNLFHQIPEEQQKSASPPPRVENVLVDLFSDKTTNSIMTDLM